MSTSSSPLPVNRLIADARFPTASISIMDGHFGMVAEGVGRLDVSLPKGIYLIQFKAGQTYEQKLVDLSDDQTVFAETLVPRPRTPQSPNLVAPVSDSLGRQSQL